MNVLTLKFEYFSMLLQLRNFLSKEDLYHQSTD